MPADPPQQPPSTPATPQPAGSHTPQAGGPATVRPPGATATLPTAAPAQPAGTSPAQPAGMPSAQPAGVSQAVAPTALAPLHGPWATTSPWGRGWPGPVRAATAATLAAVAVAAGVAAVSVPLDRAGVGWLVAAIAGVAALVIAQRVPHRLPSGVPGPLVLRSAWPTPRLTAARYGWTAATVALLGVGALRAADWLFALCVLTAALTGAFAVTGGRSLRALLTAAVTAPVATFRAVPWVAGGLARLRRSGTGAGTGLRVAATAAVSVALLVVFGALFASADESFARILRHAVPDIDGGTVVRWVFVFFVTAGLLSGAAFLRAAPPDLSALESPGTTRVRRLEWAVPIGALVALFAAFVAVQLKDMFAGSAHVVNTDGLTFAGNARGGFWQLLIVTGLTLMVLAGAARWAPRHTSTDRVLVRVLLGALAALTLVIVASALHRMDLYADTFGLTPLRLLVALCELWLGAVFVMVLIAGVRLRARWLPQVAVALAVVALLGLAVANPDELIAERNMARFEQTGRIDTWYLSDLSADAVPALDRLAEPTRSCVLRDIRSALRGDPDDWRGWNAGRERARDLLNRRPPGTTADCPRPYGD